MVLENVGLSAIAFSPYMGGSDEPGYDPFEGLSDEDAYRYADTVYQTRSREERDFFIARAKREESLRATAMANPVAGFFGGMAGGVLSPENLIPLGAVSKVYDAAKLTRNFSRAAAVSNSALTAVASTALAEAALLNMQDQRTGEQAAIGVLSSGLLVGLLGGAAHTLGAGAEYLGKQVYEATVRDADEIFQKKLNLTGKEYGELPVNHQQRVVQEALMEALGKSPEDKAFNVIQGMDNPIMKGFLRFGLRFFPSGKLETSAIEESRIFAAAGAASAVLKSNRNTVIPDAMSATNVWRKRASLESLKIEQANAQARKDILDKNKGKLKYGDIDIDPLTGERDYFRAGFYRDVTWTIRNGGKYPEELLEEYSLTKYNPVAKDIIAAAEAAAERANKFGEELFEEAKKLGGVTDGDLAGTAKGHAFRMWNHDALERNRDVWMERVPLELANKYGFEADEAEYLAQAWYDQIMNGEAGMLGLAKFVGEASNLRGRKIFLDDEFLDGRTLKDSDGNPVSFLENDMRVLLHKNTHLSAGHTEMARRFSPMVDEHWHSTRDHLNKRIDSDIRPGGEANSKTPEGKAERRQQAIEIARGVDDMHVRRALAVENTEEGWEAAKVYREASDELQQVDRQLAQARADKAKLDAEGRAVPEDQAIVDREAERLRKHNDSHERKRREVAKEAIARRDERVKASRKRYGKNAKRIGNNALKKASQLESEILRLKAEGPEVRGKGARRNEKAVQAHKARIAKLEKQIDEELETAMRAEGEALDQHWVERDMFFREAEEEIARFEMRFRAESDRIRREAQEEFDRKAATLAKVEDKAPLYDGRASDLEYRRGELMEVRSKIQRRAKYKDEIYAGSKKTSYDVSPVGDVEKNVLEMLEAGDSWTRISDYMSTRMDGLMKANFQDGVEAKSWRRWIWRAHDDRIQKARREGVSERRIQKMQRERDQEIAAMEFIRDRITNRDRFSDDPSSWIHRIDSSVRKMLFLTKMGAVTISQIPDVAGHVFVNGMAPTFQGFAQMARAMKDDFLLKGLKEDDISEAIWASEISGPLQRNLLLSAIMESRQNRSGIERGMDTMVDWMSTVSLVKFVNGAQKVTGSVITSNRIIKQAMRIASGEELSPKEMEALEVLGIDAPMAVRIAEQAAVFAKREKGGNWLPKTRTWADRDVQAAFEAAVSKATDQAVVTPDAGSMPGLMSYPILRTFLAFRNFTMTSFQKHFVPAVQRMDADTMATIVAGTGLGSLAFVLKEILAGRELPDDPREYALQGFMQGGMFSFMSEFNSIMENQSAGRFGLGPAILGEPLVPSRPGAESVMGAAWGWGEDIIDTAGTLLRQFDPSAPGLGLSEGTLGKIRRTFVPMQGIWWGRRMFDTVEDWSNRMLGVEVSP